MMRWLFGQGHTDPTKVVRGPTKGGGEGMQLPYRACTDSKMLVVTLVVSYKAVAARIHAGQVQKDIALLPESCLYIFGVAT